MYNFLTLITTNKLNKYKLLDIFSKLQEDKPIYLKRNLNARVLIIDGMNTFIRSFAAINHINAVGHHVGGLTGFLKSIGSAVKFLMATRVVIVFDGEAGSMNRKYLYPEYKANRDNQRIVNYKSFNNKGEEDDAKITEITRLMDYLKLLPVNCMCIDRLEADDVIGYLATKIYNEEKDAEISIMSSDNDFLQLINDRTTVYSPTKKKVYTAKDVVEEFGIHPENFVIYKALVGDKSDNIPGIHGIGESKIGKLFEDLAQPERKHLADIYEVCSDPPKNSVMYQRILEQMKMVEVFYKLVNLREPNISNMDREDINRQYGREIKPLQKYDFVKLYYNDRMGNTIPGVDNWVNLFSVLNNQP